MQHAEVLNYLAQADISAASDTSLHFIIWAILVVGSLGLFFAANAWWGYRWMTISLVALTFLLCGAPFMAQSTSNFGPSATRVISKDIAVGNVYSITSRQSLEGQIVSAPTSCHPMSWWNTSFDLDGGYTLKISRKGNIPDYNYVVELTGAKTCVTALLMSTDALSKLVWENQKSVYLSEKQGSKPLFR